MLGKLFKKSWRKRLAGASSDALPGMIAGLVAEALDEVGDERVADRVSNVRATSEMSLVAKVGEGEHQIFLYNLTKTLQGAPPAEREAHLLRFLRTFDATPPAVRDLVPVVKTKAWIDEARAMIQGQSPPDMVEANMIVSAPLAGDLVVVYAFDRADSMAFATYGQLRELGVDAAGLLEPAKRTLRDRLPPLDVKRGPRSAMVTCGGNFEASVILFDDVLDDLAREHDGELVAVVPARDVLMLTGTQVEGGVDEILEIAARIHSNGNYVLSTVPLLRTPEGWRPFAS